MIKIKLIRTSYACPEQYDAIYEDECIGYLRLRHGTFSVYCPDYDGMLVYFAHPKGDGIFADEQERHHHLSFAISHIALWYQHGKSLPTPRVEYVIEDGY